MPSSISEQLTLSSDGKFLLDKAGNQIERYHEKEGMFIPITLFDTKGNEVNPESVLDKKPTTDYKGWYVCGYTTSCILYDENGNCRQYAKSPVFCYKE